MNRIQFESGRELLVNVAISPQQQQQGLMHQEDPMPMVFLFQDLDKRAFWMHCTPTPLLICFASFDKIFQVSIGKPFSKKQIISNGRADMVVEIPLGTYIPQENESCRLIMNMETLSEYLEAMNKIKY